MNPHVLSDKQGGEYHRLKRVLDFIRFFLSSKAILLFTVIKLYVLLLLLGVESELQIKV